MSKRHHRRHVWRTWRAERKGRVRDLYRLARLELLEPRFVLSVPTIAAIPDWSIFQGAPLPIALQGTDADAGDVLTYQVEVSDPSAVEVLQTDPQNPTLQITMQGFGTDGSDGVMTFQLFADRVPITTQRFVDLVNQGFYNVKTFSSIVQDVEMVGGGYSSDGSGTGSSGYRFDDEFNSDLQFTREGILAMWGSGDDTNDCQFLVTDADMRLSDFDRTIFGFLTSGDDVRQAIMAVHTTNGVPDNPPVIKEAKILPGDTRNDVVLFELKSVPSTPITVTVTVSDGHGGDPTPQTFVLTPYPDNGTFGNSHPYLPGPIDPVETVENTAVTVSVTGVDAEGDPIYYAADTKPYNPSIGVNVATPTTGLIEVTPNDHLLGAYWLNIQVHNDRADDTQMVPLFIKPAAPSGITLLYPSSSGSQVTNRDNGSADKKLQFDVAGVHPGTEVTIYADGQAIGSATADSGALSVTTTVTVVTDGTYPLANGAHQITAVQVLKNQQPTSDFGNYHDAPRDLASPASEALAITVDVSDTSDTTPPVFTSKPVLGVGYGQSYEYDAETDEPSTFLLTTYPSGMTVDASTGVITWVAPSLTDPDTGELVESDYDVTLDATDRSGNTSQQSFTVHVGSPPTFSAAGSDQEINEGETVSVTVTATDDHMPLVFELVDSPDPAATLTAVDGSDSTTQSAVFDWTPGESFGPGTYTIKIRATDATNVPAVTSFQVTVDEVNQAPTIADIATQSAAEGQPFKLQLPAADADLPPNKLQYSFTTDVPAGMQLDADSGLITWTPGETDGGSSYTIGVRVSDEAGATAETSFQLNIAEVDSPPVFDPVAKFQVRPGDQLQAIVVARDPDIPASPGITYELATGAPPDMRIDATSGAITWRVPATQQPGTVSLSVRAVEVKADGSSGLSATLPLAVEVGLDNPPVFDAVGKLRVFAGGRLETTVAAHDPDVPANSIAYSLVSGAPDAMQIDATTGAIVWDVPLDQQPGTVSVVVKAVEVKDDGTTGLAQTLTFTVEVLDRLPLVVPLAFFQIAQAASVGSAEIILPAAPPREQFLVTAEPVVIGSPPAGPAESRHVFGDNGLFGTMIAPDTGRGGLTTQQLESLEGGEPKVEPTEPKRSDEKPPKQDNRRKTSRRESSEAYDEALEALLAESDRADESAEG